MKMIVINKENKTKTKTKTKTRDEMKMVMVMWQTVRWLRAGTLNKHIYGIVAYAYIKA
jgi:hypothetical protein